MAKRTFMGKIIKDSIFMNDKASGKELDEIVTTVQAPGILEQHYSHGHNVI